MRRLLIVFCVVLLNVPAFARDREQAREAPTSLFDLLFPKQRAPVPDERPVRKRTVKRVEPAVPKKESVAKPAALLTFGQESFHAADMRSIASSLRKCAGSPSGDRAFVCPVEHAGKRIDFTMTYACAEHDQCLAIAIMQEWCRSRGGTWKMTESAYVCEA